MSLVIAGKQSASTSLALTTRVLFLDFDGVLQTPALADWVEMELCEELDRLLADLPDLALVVTSTHREGRALVEVARLLPPRLAERVIDTTPVLALGRARGGRAAEIREWLAQRPWVRRWVAVDDEADLYPAGCPWLVATHKLIGWTTETTESVRELLASQVTSPR